MQSDVQKRRAMRQRKARRRQLKICLIFFLIIALIILAVMCFMVFFPIKRISVSGSKIYSKSEIIKASGLTTDDNLFVVSEDEIEQNIRKKLPYVDNVELKRNLPDAVVLTVTDAKEFACYKVGEGYYTISGSGYILKSDTERAQNVFEIITSGISGETGEKAQYENLAEKELVESLISELSENEINIDTIDVTNILNITVCVEGRFTVLLGTNENLSEKIAHLSGMIDSIGDRKGEINLSMWTSNNSQGSFVETAQ